MNKETIVIANLKCNGCATTIRKELMDIPGVEEVSVNMETDSVNVSYNNIARDIITAKLHSLGYPEATEENGLLLQLKSFSSCMLGRINNTLN